MNNRMSPRRLPAGAGAGVFSVLTAKKCLSAATGEQRINVQTGVEVCPIRPGLHGHFAGHFGAWVVRNSFTADITDRPQSVEYLRALGIPVLRWRGGCFSHDYHRSDGIGPRAQRLKKLLAAQVRPPTTFRKDVHDAIWTTTRSAGFRFAGQGTFHLLPTRSCRCTSN